MNYVIFAPSTMTVDESLSQSADTQAGLTNNVAQLPAPPVTPAQLAAQDAKVKVKQRAQADAFQLFAKSSKDLHAEKVTLDGLVMQDAIYVDGVAVLKPSTGTSTANAGGFPAKHAAVHTDQVPDTIIDLSVSQGDQSGYADFHFSPCHVIKAELYTLYYSLNVTDFTWVMGSSDKASSGTLQHLPVKVPIAFMVRGKNHNGEGGDGNVVVKTLI